MELGELNPKAAGRAIIGGMFSFFRAKSMMAAVGGAKGFVIQLLTFAATTVVCYVFVNKIADQ